MRKTIMRSLAVGLMLAPAGTQAQTISADVIVSDGWFHSAVTYRRPRFVYRRHVLEVIRWFPRRGMVVTERYRPVGLLVMPLRMSQGQGRRWLRRHGFRPVTLYLRNGRYYRRLRARGIAAGNPTLRPVVVWQRNRRLYRIVGRRPLRRLPH